MRTLQLLVISYFWVIFCKCNSICTLRHFWRFSYFCSFLKIAIWLSLSESAIENLRICAEICLKLFNLLIKKLKLLKAALCYEHAWIDQSSDLILINLIRASHDAMFSLNLAHLFESFSTLLLVVQHFLHSSLSSFF